MYCATQVVQLGDVQARSSQPPNKQIKQARMVAGEKPPATMHRCLSARWVVYRYANHSARSADRVDLAIRSDTPRLLSSS